MKQNLRILGAAWLLAGLLGCGGGAGPAQPPPTFSLDLQPGDATIPPSGVAIVYIATLHQDGQPSAFTASPQWSFGEAPSYPVGTLTPMPDGLNPDPAKRSCYYQVPGSLPQGVSRVSFKIKVLVQAGGQNVEAFRTLTLDANAPPWAPPAEALRKDVAP